MAGELAVAQVVPQAARSAAAQAALARSNLPASADGDAFMAVYDAAAADAQEGKLYLGPGMPGEVSRSACPGRPDLAIVRGRGTGGCSYIMAVRVQPQPQRVAVLDRQDQDQDQRAELRSWADADESLELELRETPEVRARR